MNWYKEHLLINSYGTTKLLKANPVKSISISASEPTANVPVPEMSMDPQQVDWSATFGDTGQ